jgi:hypothetical protein
MTEMLSSFQMFQGQYSGSYGLLAPACRQLLQQVRQGLSASIGKLKSAELITTAPVARYVFGFELQNLLIDLNRSSNVTSILASESLFQ